MLKTSKSLPAQIFLRAASGDIAIGAEQADGEDKKLRRFSMTAYTGGMMTLSGWPHPVIVDLAGLQIGKKSRPILKDHNTGSIVGHTDTVTVESGSLSVAGVVSGVGPAAQEVVGASDNGFPWQASIGANVKKVVFVPEGKTAKANGREFKGPAYIVRSSKLGEVSFVALGADDDTSAAVEALRNTHQNTNCKEIYSMEFEAWLEAKGFKVADLTEAQTASLQAMYDAEQRVAANMGDGADSAIEGPTDNQPETPDVNASAVDVRMEVQKAIKAERERVSAIQEIFGGWTESTVMPAGTSGYSDIEREAVRAGWDIETTSRKMLKAMRENRPQSDVNIHVRRDREPAEHRKVLEAALCLRVGIDSGKLTADYGERTVDAAYSDRDLTLERLFVECARMEGVSLPRGFGNDTIRAAFSTVSLPGILNNVANKKLLNAFNAQPILATRLCSSGDLNDFKENERYRLTDVGDLQPVAPDGEIKDGGVREDRATNQLETYGKKFCLTRKMVINDDLGAFMKVPVGMGNRAARLIDQLFFTRLLGNPVQADTKTLFHADHGNRLDGADSALSAEALKLAVQLFLDQTDADGQPISVEPRYLLVPTGLKHDAIELTRGATLIMAGGDASSGATPTIRPALNSQADENLAVVSSPYLANAKYAGSSDKAWYLFGNPNQVDTFEIGYLKGRRTPTVEQGEVDFNNLGMWFRVYFDLGVREQDHRGMVKSDGE